MTSDLYAAIVSRAAGTCECGHCGTSVVARGEVDHFFGRAKAEESLEACWLLTPKCHFEKTRNYPSASAWLEKFIVHAERHGYAKALERTRLRLAWVTARSSFTRARA